MSTPNTRLAAFLEQCRNQIDAELERQLCASGHGSERLQQAMRYGVLAGALSAASVRMGALPATEVHTDQWAALPD